MGKRFAYFVVETSNHFSIIFVQETGKLPKSGRDKSGRGKIGLKVNPANDQSGTPRVNFSARTVGPSSSNSIATASVANVNRSRARTGLNNRNLIMKRSRIKNRPRNKSNQEKQQPSPFYKLCSGSPFVFCCMHST